MKICNYVLMIGFIESYRHEGGETIGTGKARFAFGLSSECRCEETRLKFNI